MKRTRSDTVFAPGSLYHAKRGKRYAPAELLRYTRGQAYVRYTDTGNEGVVPKDNLLPMKDAKKKKLLLMADRADERVAEEAVMEEAEEAEEAAEAEATEEAVMEEEADAYEEEIQERRAEEREAEERRTRMRIRWAQRRAAAEAAAEAAVMDAAAEEATEAAAEAAVMDAAAEEATEAAVMDAAAEGAAEEAAEGAEAAAEGAAEAAEEAPFHVIACYFTERGEYGDFEYMIQQPQYVKDGAFMFNDNLEDLKNLARHTGGGNAVIRPYQHDDMGAHAIGFPTGPGFRSLDHAVLSFMDDDELLTVRETLDLAFARLLCYLLKHSDKKKLYYSAAMGGSKIGLGIFASCTGEDVIDYASAILVKVPEMVSEMRKAKLQPYGPGTEQRLVHIVKETARQIFVGEQKAKLSDTVPPFVYKYLREEYLPEDANSYSMTGTDHESAAWIYNEYLDDTKTLPPEWEGYVCLHDYKRCVFISWTREKVGDHDEEVHDDDQGYVPGLVNLIELAYAEYKKPDPTPIMLLVRNEMSSRGVDKFLQAYFNEKAFTESHIINFAEMTALRRITEENRLQAEPAEPAEAAAVPD